MGLYLGKKLVASIGSPSGSRFIGEIVQFFGSLPPYGTLYCDGSVITKAQYAKLFTIMGYSATEDYDNSKKYKIGDYVMYSTAMYRCKTAIDVPEEFDPSKWEVDTIHFQLPDFRGKYMKGDTSVAPFGTKIYAGLPLPVINEAGAHTHTIYGCFSDHGSYHPGGNWGYSGAYATTSTSGQHTHTFDETGVYKSTNTTVDVDAVVVKYSIVYTTSTEQPLVPTSGGVTFDDVYPVGSVYISIDGTHPALGTWIQLATGRTLWNTATGNSLIEAGLPGFTLDTVGDHQHSGLNTHYVGDFWHSGSGAGYVASMSTSASGLAGAHTHVVQPDTIYGQSTTVQPPAIAVTMWQRTA